MRTSAILLFGAAAMLPMKTVSSQTSGAPQEVCRYETGTAAVRTFYASVLEGSVRDSEQAENVRREKGSFPAFLPGEMYRHFRTPAAVTYGYVLDSLFRTGRVSRVGSPKMTEKKVSIDYYLDGEKQILWFVEKSRKGDEATVVAGPPDAGGDLFRLRRIDGKWAIMGIETSDGI